MQNFDTDNEYEIWFDEKRDEQIIKDNFGGDLYGRED